jgi:hypothetical protein
LLKQLRATSGINGHSLIPDGVDWSKPGPLAKYPRTPNSDVLLYQWDNGHVVPLTSQFVQAIG